MMSLEQVDLAVKPEGENVIFKRIFYSVFLSIQNVLMQMSIIAFEGCSHIGINGTVKAMPALMTPFPTDETNLLLRCSTR